MSDGRSSFPAPPLGRTPILLVFAALAGTALALYWRVRTYDFVMLDDALYVFENPRVLGGFTRSGVAWAFSTWETGNWHPLTWLSLMLDVEFFGGGAGLMHQTNLVLHAANGAGFFLVLQMLTGALLPSALVAFLFLFHPLHVESMAWISERKDVLSALFWMLTMAAYASYVRRPGALRYARVLIAFGLGLMAKPILVTLPFVLLLLDYWPLGRDRGCGRRQRAAWAWLVAEKLPLFLLSVLSSVIALRAQAAAHALAPTELLAMGLRVGGAIAAYGRYLGKTLWPSRLTYYYPHPEAGLSWGLVAASGLLLAALSLLVFLKRRSSPWLAVGWCWYLGTLVPMIGIVQVGQQGWADRYTYVPLVGVFIALAWGGAALAGRGGVSSVIAAMLFLPCAMLLMGAARHQVGFWRDGVTIGSRSVEVNPGHYVGWQEIGLYQQRQGRSDVALRFLERARELSPDNFRILFNIGWVHDGNGRYEEALRYYRDALALNPEAAAARTNLGVVLSRLGQHREAVSELERAVSALPGSEAVRRSLGFALARAGESGRAEEEYRRALAINPEYVPARSELGYLLLHEGLVTPAEVELSEALRRSPGDPELLYNLGVIAQSLDRREAAMARYREALRLRPDFLEALTNLGAVLLREGRAEEAVVVFSRAAHRKPGNHDYRKNLEKAKAVAAQSSKARQ